MSMTVAEAAELLKTDATTFIINAMSRFAEAETWNATTELPEEMIEALEVGVNQYQSASAPDRTVAQGSDFNGSLVKSTGDALASTHVCAEALEFAFHEIDSADLDRWLALGAMSANDKIQMFETGEAHVLTQWREGRAAKTAASFERCLGDNQSKLDEVLSRHGISPASRNLGNAQRQQAATSAKTSKILAQVLAISAKTK